MSDHIKLDDPAIRRGLRRRFLPDQHPKALILEERHLGRWTRPVDIAAIEPDDTIHCYEIKSDKDSVTRLGDQLLSYSLFSHYVTVVTGAKSAFRMLRRIDKLGEKDVGFIVMHPDPGGLRLEHVREPQRICPPADWMLMILLKSQLLRLGRKLGLSKRQMRLSKFPLIDQVAARLTNEGVDVNACRALREMYGHARYEPFVGTSSSLFPA